MPTPAVRTLYDPGMELRRRQGADARAVHTVDRQTRRKRETREKLIDGAHRVMAHKGIDATTIQEITDAADVGFGSFYNHFDSKKEIVDAIIRERIEPFGGALDVINASLEDPAEILSAKVRHTVRKAMGDATWGRFLFFSAIDAPSARTGLLPRLTRDLKAGIKARRFEVVDLEYTVVAVSGTVGAVTRAWLRSEVGTDAPERAAALILHLLGVPHAEARKISVRPLPEVGPSP